MEHSVGCFDVQVSYVSMLILNALVLLYDNVFRDCSMLNWILGIILSTCMWNNLLWIYFVYIYVEQLCACCRKHR